MDTAKKLYDRDNASDARSLPVVIKASLTYCIGEVECQTLKEYDEKAKELWANQDNKKPDKAVFDISGLDWELDDVSEQHFNNMMGATNE